MSNVYALAPPTCGKVVLNTTLGPLDVELWSKEAPKTCRNFMQLCMEGFYDNTIFHRLLKGFMVQGGDPTGTGTGGESIYGGPFKDEFHSRLRFVHRGIVAMANNGKHSNLSQFFITLDKTPHLDRQNTIFGKIAGDTIYNIVKVDDLETDDNDRPIHPPKILSVDIIWNPFDDIVPRKKEKVEEKKVEKKKKKKCARKDLKLLSFGEEVEEQAQELEGASIQSKMKGSYAYSDDPRVKELLQKQKKELAEKEKVLAAEREHDADEESAKPVLHAVRGDFEHEMAEKIKKMSSSSSTASTQAKGHEDKSSRDEEEREAEAASAGVGKKRARSNWVEEQRQKYKRAKTSQKDRKQKAAEKLEAFQNMLKRQRIEREAQGATGARGGCEDGANTSAGAEPPHAEAEQEEEETDEGWMTHALKFEPGSRVRDPLAREDNDVYVTIDPLKETSRKAMTKHEQHLKRISRKKPVEKW